MKIFSILKSDEGWRNINYPVARDGLKAKGVPPSQSGVTTSP
jgi:hypothetical protein